MESLALRALFNGAFADRRVLVTGHTGFKGSWLCLWLDAIGAEVTGMSLPDEGTQAHWPLLKLDKVRSLAIDLRDAAAVREAMEEIRPEVVFHLAAQSLVRVSYRDPATTFSTNVAGLVNLLEAVRSCDSVRAMVNATTDKVYLEMNEARGYRETDALGGHDPYSTSKACAELITECYRKSFLDSIRPFLRVATARAGNVIGGGDWAEDRLVPDLVRSSIASVPLRIRNPHAIRPWQHVLESLSGYLSLAQALLDRKSAEGSWNFGPDESAALPVCDLVAQWMSQWPGAQVESADGWHPHEAAVLLLDSSKAARELYWKPIWKAETTICRTIDWYRNYYQDGILKSRDDLAAYVDDATAARLHWAIPS
ncbi:CDP-glucose 4,6-dehydratase [Dokdonella sp.]|uniref:CDP-glucose 4,6-dehydratase n=1 Tax=Dokdonella sp. TaxID=2291710 RepID=UPI003527284F